MASYSRSLAMSSYFQLQDHTVPFLTRDASGDPIALPLLLPTLRAHLLALSALRPPFESVSLALDASFGCIVTGRCACFADADRFEWLGGAAAAAGEDGSAADGGVGRCFLRELRATRYAHIDDPTIVSGLGAMLSTARRDLRQQLAKAPLPLVLPRALVAVREHARVLRRQVEALPRRGDVLSPAVWRCASLPASRCQSPKVSSATLPLAKATAQSASFTSLVRPALTGCRSRA